MTTPVEIVRVALEIRGALIDAGETDFEGEPLDVWDIKVNHRFSSAAGRCKMKEKVIELSLQYFSIEEYFLLQLRNTVLHEFAHAIVGVKRKVSTGRFEKHGWEWKSCMYRIGGNPQTLHNMELPSRQDKRRVINCESCDKEVAIGKIQYRRLMSGQKNYYHSGPLGCKQPILKRRPQKGDPNILEGVTKVPKKRRDYSGTNFVFKFINGRQVLVEEEK